jgi:hypothetical protein
VSIYDINVTSNAFNQLADHFGRMKSTLCNLLLMNGRGCSCQIVVWQNITIAWFQRVCQEVKKRVSLGINFHCLFFVVKVEILFIFWSKKIRFLWPFVIFQFGKVTFLAIFWFNQMTFGFYFGEKRWTLIDILLLKANWEVHFLIIF